MFNSGQSGPCFLILSFSSTNVNVNVAVNKQLNVTLNFIVSTALKIAILSQELANKR